MTNHEKEVITKIIYAVETGGQVYGKQRYNDFTEAFANVSTEYAITIGAGQWYGVEAKKLLYFIRSTDAALFKSLDTAGIGVDLDTKDWSTYRASKTSAKAKCIQKIIDTEVGHKCQDALIVEQMETYMNRAKGLGVTDIDAQMMCANFQHQGGAGAVTRILAKTKKPYTLDNLYTACQSDTGNQVGAYKNRQKFVYNALKTHLKNEGGNAMTIQEVKDRLLAVAEAEVGYLEKKSNSQLDSKTANAGYNNYTKYWRDLYPSFQAQPWCAIWVTWIFVQVFGIENTEKLLKHYPYTYCPSLGNLFTKYANPEVMDIVIFYRGGEFVHTGIVSAVNGDYFETIEGNTSAGSSIVPNGGAVCRKSYYNSSLPGTKFCRIDWELAASMLQDLDSSSPNENVLIRKGDNGNNVKEIQKMLDKMGYDIGSAGVDGDFGSSTEKAVKAFQTDRKLEVDGIVGKETIKRLREEYKVSQPDKLYSKSKRFVAQALKEGVHVRLSASSKAEHAAWPRLGMGNLVDVLGETGNWYYIDVQGRRGFTSKDRLGDVSKMYQIWASKTTSGANIREKASSKSDIVANVPKNTGLKIIGEEYSSSNTLWYKVVADEKYEGYIQYARVQEK